MTNDPRGEHVLTITAQDWKVHSRCDPCSWTSTYGSVDTEGATREWLAHVYEGAPLEPARAWPGEGAETPDDPLLAKSTVHG